MANKPKKIANLTKPNKTHFPTHPKVHILVLGLFSCVEFVLDH